MMNIIIKIAKVLFSYFTGKLIEPPCRYSKGCPLYQIDGHTCNSDDEASSGNNGKPYCGKFKMIEKCKHTRQICKLTGYDTVALICKECGYHVTDGRVYQSPKKLSFKDP